ncbi:MAG: nucleotidyltransferase family protein [Desulfobaccales bacterium]
MTRTREAVLQQLEANREKIRSFGVKRLGLFGSCARGEASAKSDLDFVVEFSQKSFDAYMDLKDFLEGLFGCPVDLVLNNTIKPRLRKPILSEVVYVQGL